MKVAEFYERALKAKRVEEREFDLKLLPGKLKELIKKYDIHCTPGEFVPQDLDMAKRVFDAGMDLITELGVYCSSTKGIIAIGREEVKNALRNAPSSHIIGEGAEAVECHNRGIEDKRRPIIIGGAQGCPLSEDNYLDILTSYAKEPIDSLHTGAIQTLFGITVKAATPIELMACHYEVLWAREAIRRAGKPGLNILGIMSGVTSEAQDAGDFPGGLRPSDTHLLCPKPELKINWEDLKKIAHNQNQGRIIEACPTPIIGAYVGGPEGAAIAGVAEVMECYLIARPTSAVCSIMSSRYIKEPKCIWTGCMIPLAFISAGQKILIGDYVIGVAGPCTDMICDELAAQTVALTAAGQQALSAAGGRQIAVVDYVTGMESRIVSEISQAVAGMSLAQASEIVKELVGKYQDALDSKKIPEGKSFTECYDRRLMPSSEYLELWHRKKKELEKMGIPFS